MQRWFYWYKFQLNFIPMFYLSQLESLVLYEEFPAWSPPAWVEHPVPEFARYDASEEKKVFHASPRGIVFSNTWGWENWRNTLSVTLQKSSVSSLNKEYLWSFIHAPGPGQPGSHKCWLGKRRFHFEVVKL